MPDFWTRMQKADADITTRATGMRDHVFADGALTRRTKELIYLGMCCATRFPDGIRIHAHRALEHGATRAEVYEAVALSVVAAGIPAYREAVKLLWEVLWPELPPPTGT